MNQSQATAKERLTHNAHQHARSSPAREATSSPAREATSSPAREVTSSLAREATRSPTAAAGPAEGKHEEPSLPAARDEAVRRAEAWLAARGVLAGDVVAVCAPDSIDVAVTRCAVSSIDAVAVTLSPSAPRRDLFAQLCVSGARWLVTTPDLFAQKLEVAVRPSAVAQTFLIGGAAASLIGGAQAPRAQRFDVLDADGGAAVVVSGAES